ncbi:XRE family transcriptional regulator [Streptomyces phaeochromogenes]|uniref:XRE family transcriptional regulator n=1 Tax=Streptomyces phaeochromogenes TaxID=1923 RepID=UPI00367C0503
MTPPSVPQQQPAEDPSGTSGGPPDPPAPPVDSRQAAAVRRGRKSDPVSDKAGPCHQAWLHPVRGRISASGLTLDQLVSLTGYSKTRISTLLRGAEYYPGWEITYSVVHALDLPVWPLRRLWTAGAREADKDQAWIEERIHEVRPLEPEVPPLAHQAFTEAMREPYTAYARALLHSDRRACWVVAEAFDILWLDWDEAVASPDVRRHAWRLLRSRVMLRAHRHGGGHPDLRPAAFTTVAQDLIGDLTARFAEISALAGFFDAVGRLPADQFDVVVLRYLCGLDVQALHTVLGLSAARTHALDHHARGALESSHRPDDTPGVINPT